MLVLLSNVCLIWLLYWLCIIYIYIFILIDSNTYILWRVLDVCFNCSEKNLVLTQGKLLGLTCTWDLLSDISCHKNTTDTLDGPVISQWFGQLHIILTIKVNYINIHYLFLIFCCADVSLCFLWLCCNSFCCISFLVMRTVMSKTPASTRLILKNYYIVLYHVYIWVIADLLAAISLCMSLGPNE